MEKRENIYRIIDANFNRAREGLRVVEDFSRFILDDANLSSDIKKTRHNLDLISRDIYPKLIACRNSSEDIFRKTKEPAKKDVNSVVISNIKRAEESVRTLEEFSKIISSSAGAGFKKIRFKIYDIEKAVADKMAAGTKKNPQAV